MDDPLGRVTFGAAEIRVEGYPYRPAGCWPCGVIAARELREVSPGCPPVVRLKRRDVVFVEKKREGELVEFARRNGVPVVERHDPWGWVLEPFLDTTFTVRDRLRTLRVLRANGISAMQCWVWRRRFRRAVISYNFDSMLWEWGWLGATDLLDAHMGRLAKAKFALGEREFEQLYRLVVGVLWDAAEGRR